MLLDTKLGSPSSLPPVAPLDLKSHHPTVPTGSCLCTPAEHLTAEPLSAQSPGLCTHYRLAKRERGHFKPEEVATFPSIHRKIYMVEGGRDLQSITWSQM